MMKSFWIRRLKNYSCYPKIVIKPKNSEKFKYNSVIIFNKMAEEDKKFSRQMIGKTIVSKTGKRFGEVGDIIFETRSGELIHLVLANPTSYTEKLELEKDKQGNILIPFSAVMAMGDFMVISEEDIV